jgi:endoglucanase
LAKGKVRRSRRAGSGGILSIVTAAPNPLPRWRGFNLLEMYTARSDAPFREEDFCWIADWGFDFVRLPLCYTLWIVADDPFRIDENGPALARLDKAAAFAERNGLHLCLNLHRAPGYCVNAERKEPFDLWRDAAALEAFCLHWRTLARRYRGISSRCMSFDLLNEPPRPRPFGGCTRTRHARVMRAAVAAIREADPARLIIIDGLDYGRQPCPELADLPNVAQSCRAYEPFELSHYRAPWMPGAGQWRRPAWPLRRDFLGRRWSRARLEMVYARWTALFANGTGVHCGEAGCFSETPHDVFLAWFGDALDVLKNGGIGWALWNFRGPFGVLDSGRGDVAYENWRGHLLDRALLDLLRAN